MEIKHEPVFGPQELFIDAKKDAVVVVKYDDIEVFFSCYSDFFDHLRAVGRGLSVDAPVIAMRRIISTPTWTVADQKAGKLPEVGCRIYVPVMIEEQTVIYSSEKVIVSISDNGGAVTRTEVGSINRIKPIESPEEKAARLRNKWCNRAMDCSTIQQLYDAMLSGEIPVPAAPEQNK